MTTTARRVFVALVAVSLLLACRPAGAQTNERLFEGLDFRFATPGARAVGMGVTFVGLADDATAAASNPGGLSNLRHVEFSVEFLGSESSQRYLVGNQRNGVLCEPSCDVYRTFGRTSWVLPSFASVAIPLGDVTLAGFFNTQQRFTRTFDLEPRIVPRVMTPLGPVGPIGQTGESGELSASVRNYGVSGAWVAQPWLSVGASLVLSHLDLQSEGRNLEGDTLRSRTRTSASVMRPALFAGALLHPTARLALGVGYYRRTVFPMQTDVAGTFANPLRSAPPDRCVNTSFSQPDRLCDFLPPLRTDYVVPTRIAVGGSYRIARPLTVVGELAHVRYSEMRTANFQIIDFRYTGDLSPSQYSYANVNELHAGAEYRHDLGGQVLALRAGLFTDPAHSLRFRMRGQTGGDAVENFIFNLNASTGTRVGVTLGAGVAVGNRLQADAAVSLLPGANRLVLSLVRRVL